MLGCARKGMKIYLMRKLRRDTLGDIGETFQMEKYSSVSSVIERLKSRMQNDPKLKKRVRTMESLMEKR